MLLAFFGQTFEARDLVVIGFLIVLEGVLSIDNALVLGLLARRLPKHLQPRALTYGLIGAFVFRIAAIATAGLLLKWELPKLLGGLYLVWVAVKALFIDRPKPIAERASSVGKEGATSSLAPHLSDFAPTAETHFRAFWTTVAVIELTDIAFAVDSILAAIGTVPGREKLWIVITGGMLGVVLMRFAAVIFIRILERFPRFEMAAYLLVAVIGTKLVLDYFFHLDFHNPAALPFWIFWGLMALSFASGFIPRDEQRSPRATT